MRTLLACMAACLPLYGSIALAAEDPAVRQPASEHRLTTTQEAWFADAVGDILGGLSSTEPQDADVSVQHRKRPGTTH